MNECGYCGHRLYDHMLSQEHYAGRRPCMQHESEGSSLYCDCIDYRKPKAAEYSKGPEDDDIKF